MAATKKTASDAPARGGLAIRRVPIASLHNDPANARAHDERNLDAITASLQRFGQAEPLIVHGPTGRVIGGNGRLVAMRKLGWTEVDVVQLEVDDLEATALGIALNRTAELAAWNEPALAELLKTLAAEDALDGTGFDEVDLDDLIATLEGELANQGEIVEDVPPEPGDAAVSRRGDLWLLGDHRLLCGDSASWDDVERLVGGREVHLVHMDPPYNVKVEPRSNNAIAAGLSSFAPTKPTHHQALDLARHPGKAKATGKMRPKDRPLANDFIGEEAFDELLGRWFENASRALVPGGAFYIWGGYANLGNYPGPIAAAGLYFSQAIVWNKLHPVLTRKDYMGAFELCFYGWKEGAAHRFFGPNNVPDIWEVKKLHHTQMVHLTEKVVELPARAMEYSTLVGECVLDLFGGSGSTLMAAEQRKRVGLALEIDELYVDVIVERWQKFTGREARLEATGQTFAAVKEERAP